MSLIKSVVVFCGASAGKNKIFTETAYKMGQLLAESNVELIYGAGGKAGMMKSVAEGAISEEGSVIGATIRSLYSFERPDLSTNARKIEVWQKMCDRKVSMTKQADGICVLPGGFGTMDEMFEVLTLRQIGISRQPIVIVNTNGYYNTLKRFLQEIVDEGFARPDQLEILKFVDTVDEVLPTLRAEAKLLEQEALAAKSAKEQSENASV